MRNKWEIAVWRWLIVNWVAGWLFRISGGVDTVSKVSAIVMVHNRLEMAMWRWLLVNWVAGWLFRISGEVDAVSKVSAEVIVHYKWEIVMWVWLWRIGRKMLITASTEIAATEKSTKSRNLRFLGISRYTFKLRFGFDLNLYRGIWVSGFSGFRACSILSGICHMTLKNWREKAMILENWRERAMFLEKWRERAMTLEEMSYETSVATLIAQNRWEMAV